MKYTLLLPLLAYAFLFGTPAQAQKAKFKNLKSTVQKTRLPAVYVAPEDRTYDLYVKGSYSADVEPYNGVIRGWKVNNENPNMEAVVSLYGFQVNPSKRTSEKKQTKDKEGKVTASWTEYTYTGSAVGKGTLYIYGSDNAFKYEKMDSDKSKSELAREAKAEAARESAKEELAANPFLSADDAAGDEEEDAGESDVSEDSGMDDALLPLVQTSGLDVSKSVSTGAHRSVSKAYKNYREVQRPKLSSLRNSYPRTAYGNAIKKLNARYGYSPVNYAVWLKKMKSDKHPEYKMWNDACTATATMFKGFKFNKSIDGAQGKFEPIVSYFEGKIAEISDKDRKGKKMKQAAFNNAANILFYLDMHDEAMALSDKYLDSKFLNKAAKKMRTKAHRQKSLMEFHHVSTCHLTSEIDDEDDAEVETEEEEADEDDDSEGKR